MKSYLLTVSVSILILTGCALEKRFSWDHPDKGWGRTTEQFNNFDNTYTSGTPEFYKDHKECDDYASRNLPTYYTVIKYNDAISTIVPKTYGSDYREIFIECMQDKYGWKREEAPQAHPYGPHFGKYEPFRSDPVTPQFSKYRTDRYKIFYGRPIPDAQPDYRIIP